MVLIGLCLALIVAAATRCAWGPGHHLEFEHRVWRNRNKLPPRVRELLEAERPAYQYGNIAADIINFKGAGGPYSHCHRWGIIDDMNALAGDDRSQRAFVLGYLSHLAADTIAHNHFVPYHLARYARTQGLGHLYWELNADRFVPEERWKVVTDLKSRPELTELDELVNRTVAKKALSMRTNKLLFNHVLLISERDRWRRGVARLHGLSSTPLEPEFLELFRTAAVGRIRLALHKKGLREIVRVDANGKEAQAAAMRMRRGLLERWTSPKRRWEDAEPRAAGFLLGMQSPPPARV